MPKSGQNDFKLDFNSVAAACFPKPFSRKTHFNSFVKWNFDNSFLVIIKYISKLTERGQLRITKQIIK